jgi:predicted dehydrogenase
MSVQRPLRLGMVGGGEGAYIGNIHRLASRLDGQWQLVAGAFDVDPLRGREFAIGQGLDPSRSYGSYQELISGEVGREDRVDAVAICTPNFTHYPIAKALIEEGFDVICEKPLTATLEDAVALEQLARDSGRFVGVTYTYSGYPLVHEARVRVARGDIGEVRSVQVEYPLEWMATAIEQQGNAQAAWRTDPKKNGRGGSVGDIGTHAYHLAGFVTGLKLDLLTADLATFVEEPSARRQRPCDDALSGRRARLVVVFTGRFGQLERRAVAGLRLDGLLSMVPGTAERIDLRAAGRPCPDHQARRR